MERKCYKCKKIKSIESFVKDNRNKTGYGYLCKECKKEEDKKYHAKIKQDPNRWAKELEMRRNWKRDNRKKVQASWTEYNNRPEVKEQKSEWARKHFNVMQLTEKQYIHKMWRNAKSRAIKENIPFNIEETDIIIPKYCPILETELVLNKNYKNSNPEHTPSIDKIDPTKGYVKGNIQIISFKANAMKQNASFDELQKFSKNIPNVVLDGELYIHGKPLSYISGIVRLQDLCEKHEELQYYVYDIVDETKTFQERLKILTELDKCMSLSSIIPNRVVVVNHESVSGKDAIVQLHNQYISEGYEGLVIRDPNEKYKCGARDKRMLKVKMFQDDEFEITGMTDGLREEDFVFNMKTKDGYPFEAKPMGDRALKKWYRENIDKLIGQMGTVKYFGYTATENAVPNLPVFKSLRDKTDL